MSCATGATDCRARRCCSWRGCSARRWWAGTPPPSGSATWPRIPAEVYEKVAARPGTTFATLARAAVVGVESLRELNPELVRERTPPDRGPYDLRVPPGSAKLVTRGLNDELTQADEVITHFLRVGESLDDLAARYGIANRELRQAQRRARRLRAAGRGDRAAAHPGRGPQRAGGPRQRRGPHAGGGPQPRVQLPRPGARVLPGVRRRRGRRAGPHLQGARAGDRATGTTSTPPRGCRPA